MTSDSPLRGASCLQSAVRLLVIIFQSVTLVSALWRCERREDGGPAGWMAEAESEGGSGQGVMLDGGQHLRSCVYVCARVCVWTEAVVVGRREQAVTALYSPPLGCVRILFLS